MKLLRLDSQTAARRHRNLPALETIMGDEPNHAANMAETAPGDKRRARFFQRSLIRPADDFAIAGDPPATSSGSERP